MACEANEMTGVSGCESVSTVKVAGRGGRGRLGGETRSEAAGALGDGQLRLGLYHG